MLNNIEKMEKKLKEIRVKDIMSRFAITTIKEASISDLSHLFMRFKISGVPVLGEERKIIGIVTATDLFDCMQKFISKIDNKPEEELVGEFFVQDIMITKVFTVEEDTTLYEVIKLMFQENIHTLPVVNKEEIVGVVGRRDVINAFYSEEKKDGERL